MGWFSWKATAFFCWVLAAPTLTGCKLVEMIQQTAGQTRPGPLARPQPHLVPDFQTIYAKAAASAEEENGGSSRQLVSLEADDLPLSQCLLIVARQTGVSILANDSLDSRRVTASLKKVPIDEALTVIARRVDSSIAKVGSVYVLGEALPEDRGVLVRRVRRLDRQGLRDAVGVFQAEDGRFTTFDDGLVIVGDRVEVLATINSMLDQLEAADSPVWVVELYLVTWSKRAVDELGINLEPAANVALSFAIGSAVGVTGDWGLESTLDAVLGLAREREDVAITSSPMFLLVDGSSSRIVQGDRLPVPQAVTTTTVEGATRNESFDFVQTGTTVNVALREVEEDRARVDVEVRISDVRGFVQEAPITAEQSFNTTAVVEGDGVYLLGSMVRDRASDAESLGWRTATDHNRDVQLLQVWARTRRIVGSVDQQSAEDNASQVVRAMGSPATDVASGRVGRGMDASRDAVAGSPPPSIYTSGLSLPAAPPWPDDGHAVVARPGARRSAPGAAATIAGAPSPATSTSPSRRANAAAGTP